jgi:hypothetical protein
MGSVGILTSIATMAKKTISSGISEIYVVGGNRNNNLNWLSTAPRNVSGGRGLGQQTIVYLTFRRVWI